MIRKWMRAVVEEAKAKARIKRDRRFSVTALYVVVVCVYLAKRGADIKRFSQSRCDRGRTIRTVLIALQKTGYVRFAEAPGVFKVEPTRKLKALMEADLAGEAALPLPRDVIREARGATKSRRKSRAMEFERQVWRRCAWNHRTEEARHWLRAEYERDIRHLVSDEEADADLRLLLRSRSKPRLKKCDEERIATGIAERVKAVLQDSPDRA